MPSLDEAPEDRPLPLRWRREYMRQVRDSWAGSGPLQCPACNRSAPPRSHPLDWLSLIEYPALVSHGAPGEEQQLMYISGYCRYCYYSLMFSAGSTWRVDHPDPLSTAI